MNNGTGSCWWTGEAGWYFLVVPVCKPVGDRLTEEVESNM